MPKTIVCCYFGLHIALLLGGNSLRGGFIQENGKPRTEKNNKKSSQITPIGDR
jgi:hypothetical protein